ncbi:MAG: hypothetical protein ACFE8B_10950 [Candidatus Hermodarchaeota archaeon]
MSESKAERLILVFIIVTLTGLLTVLFQNNFIVYLVGFLVASVIYFFGYPLRKKLVTKIIKPMKRVISDLERYDKIKGDPKEKRKVMNKLYNHLKQTVFLESSTRIIPSNSAHKPSFTFQKEGEAPLLTIQFFILSGDDPYRFQISGKNENYYSDLKKQAPNRTPEENKDNLENLLTTLKELR